MNLSLDPLLNKAIKEENFEWLGLLEQEPDAGLGNGGLGRLAACFLDSMEGAESIVKSWHDLMVIIASKSASLDQRATRQAVR